MFLCPIVGFKVEDRGCCGTGLIEVTFSCRWHPTCLSDSDYVFWDSFHPTEAAYKKLVIPLLQNYVHRFIWAIIFQMQTLLSAFSGLINLLSLRSRVQLIICAWTNIFISCTFFKSKMLNVCCNILCTTNQRHILWMVHL